MPVMLKWKGNELFLGKTKMAEVITVSVQGKTGKYDVETFRYVLGPEDRVSEPYERAQDARNDCTDEVARLLKNAGVEVSGG
jgi:hypothetical protein